MNRIISDEKIEKARELVLSWQTSKLIDDWQHAGSEYAIPLISILDSLAPAQSDDARRVKAALDHCEGYTTEVLEKGPLMRELVEGWKPAQSETESEAMALLHKLEYGPGWFDEDKKFCPSCAPLKLNYAKEATGEHFPNCIFDALLSRAPVEKPDDEQKYSDAYNDGWLGRMNLEKDWADEIGEIIQRMPGSVGDKIRSLKLLEYIQTTESLGGGS